MCFFNALGGAVDIAMRNKEERYDKVVGIVSYPDSTTPKVNNFSVNVCFCEGLGEGC